MVTQTVNPTADDTVGNWVTAPLWSKINDYADSPDDDYIQCAAALPTICKVDAPFSAVAAGTITGIKVYIRAKKIDTITLFTFGYDCTGSGIIAENITATVTTSWAEYTKEVTGLSYSVADVSDLVLFMNGTCTPTTGRCQVSAIKIVYTYLADITETFVIEGTITQSEMGYQKAEFKLKEDAEIELDQDIKITEDYTSLGATSEAIIFEGMIQDYSLTDVKDISAVSRQDEVARIQPLGYYTGITTVRLSKMIEEYGDFIAASYGPNTWDGYFDAKYNFADEGDNIDKEINFVDDISGNPACTVEDTIGTTHNKVLKIDNSAPGGDAIQHWLPLHDDGGHVSGTIEFWWYVTGTTGEHWDWEFKDTKNWAINENFRIVLDGTKFDWDDATGYTFSINTWYRIRVDFEFGSDAYLGLAADTWNLYLYNAAGATLYSKTGRAMLETGDSLVCLETYNGNTNRDMYMDGWDTSWNELYTIGNNADEIIYNLPSSTRVSSVILNGGQTLHSLLTEGAITEKHIWALAPDGDVRWHDMDEVSGVTLDDTIDIWDVSAKIQAKRINRVVLKGAGGLESVKNDTDRQTSSGQIIIYQDYRADITNQTDLNIMAQSILDIQKNPPLIVQLAMAYEAVGWIQVGETVTITGGKIKYNNSSSYIPAGDYRIISETYHMKDGVYHYVELTLADGLQYTEQLDKDKIDHNTQNANTAYGGTIISGGSGINNIKEDTSPQLGGDLDLNGKNIDFPTTANISDCLDEDNMASNSATMLATQQSIKAYSDTHINDTTNVHGAVSAATASKLVERDAAGRAKFVASAAAGDAVIHEQLHPQLTNLNELGTRLHSDLQTVTANQHHNEAHSIASHNDTTATGAELETLTDGSETALHSHAGGGGGFNPPIGFITMFSGTWVDNSTIPGWYKCDGNNGTVNLVNKFVRGGATSGATGGSDDAVVVSHTHNLKADGAISSATRIARSSGNYAWAGYLQATGESGVNKNIPAYYTLIFIQRIS